MSVLWAEHIKPRCKGSGTLMAKSGIRSEFPQRSCRLRVAILMGFVCHLEKGINKNALMHCEELPGEWMQGQGYKGQRVCGQPVCVGLTATASINHKCWLMWKVAAPELGRVMWIHYLEQWRNRSGSYLFCGRLKLLSVHRSTEGWGTRTRQTPALKSSHYLPDVTLWNITRELPVLNWRFHSF